jgi:glucose/arabinose dehydrogenase
MNRTIRMTVAGRRVQGVLALCLIAGAACAKGDQTPADTAGTTPAGAAGAAPAATACPGDNDGLTLPAGFCATVFADSLGHARHIVVAANGDVYVNTQTDPSVPKGSTPDAPFVVALRDTTGDGKADVIVRFGTRPTGSGTGGGTGIGIHAGALYVEEGARIVRYALPPGGLAPTAAAEVIVSGLPITGDHTAHNFVIDSAGTMYVNIGSATNSCQTKNRTPEIPGAKPCTELETRAGIWQYDANKTGQRFSAKERYATGIRNAVGLAFASDGSLWSTQHGRDQLAENWSKLYTPQQGQDLPAEELLKIEKGADFGWPTCYFDPGQQKLVLAPEYGGDGGKAVGDCGNKKAPVAFFPAHWAPDGLLFYTGSKFPAKYRDGAFIAFHGSWNRAPGPQGGYQVVFQPLPNGVSSGAYETFADKFAGDVVQPDNAKHRPVGLAQSPDGAIYVTDDQHGRVWRIAYGR